MRPDGIAAEHGPVEHVFRWASVTKLATALAVARRRRGRSRRARGRRRAGGSDRAAPARPRERAAVRGRASDRAARPAADLLQPGLRGARRTRRGERRDAVRAVPRRGGAPAARAGRGAARLAGRGRARHAARRRGGSPTSCSRRRSSPRRRWPRRRRSSSPAWPASFPASAASTRSTGVSGSSSRTRSRGTGPGSSNSPRTFGHFGGAGTFLWVDPELALALVVLTDREFGDWALAAWPALSDAVVSEGSRAATG